MSELGKDKKQNNQHRRRKPKTVGHEAFDVVFEVLPSLAIGKGPRRTPSQAHCIRIYNEALGLKAKSVTMTLDMIKANDTAIREQRRFVPEEYRGDDFGDFEFSDPGNANRALVILGIASIKAPVADNSGYEGSSPLILESWAVEAGLKRHGRRCIHSADRAAIARHTRADRADYVTWDNWPSLPEPAPRVAERPKGPSFESQKFKPDVSGNSKGRPPRPKYNLPFPFLNKMAVINIHGVDYRMTRAQVLLRHLSTATFPKDSSLPEIIGKAMIEATKERWKRPPAELPKYGSRTPGQLNFSGCLEFLLLARKLNRMRVCRRMVIEPWIVQQALALLVEENEPLSAIEQQIVVEATRTPWKVNWPVWWEIEIPCRRKKAIN